MFIVKAEVRSDVGPQAYQMFEAPSVRVGRPEMVVPSISDPELCVNLCDIDDSTFKSLGVGHGLQHYSAIYIMNERGKTVDSVYPGPAPATSMPQVQQQGVGYTVG